MLGCLLRWGGIVIVVLFAAIQLVPYGWVHTNPPVRAEPAWDSPQTRQLAVRACYNCHSNETVWPLYSYIAPISWLIRRNVEEGRAKLNFSEWDRPQEDGEEAAETVQEGSMPPRDYLWLHPEARLTAAERQALVQGLLKTLGSGGEERDERD